jgi:Nucleotidyltransferase of unknown function (DUF6036)
LPTRVLNKSIPEPWCSFLGELDRAIETEVRLDCMGGFVVTLVYGFSRPTADLDVLEIAPREAAKPMLQLGMQGGPLHKKYKIYLDPVGVAHVPENYEDRLTEIFPKSCQHLRLCALDPYDLALSKLERNIQRDRDDVKYLARTIPLDLEVLRERYRKELRWQLGNPEREDLTLKLWIDAIEEEKRK